MRFNKKLVAFDFIGIVFSFTLVKNIICILRMTF